MKLSPLFAVLLSLAIAIVAPAASAQNAKIPQRADIEAKYKWRLDDIYPDTLAWEADFARLQTQMGEIAKFQGHLGESAETLYRCLSLRDSLSSLLDRLFVYAHMKKDEDTRM